MLTNPEPAELNQLFEDVSGYFALLSEPTRIKILYTLCMGERPVGDIVDQVGSTQANVSRHLNMLYRAKVLARRKEGTQVYYRIDDDNTMNLCRTVCTQMSERIEQQTTFNKDVVKKFIRVNG
ncbi:metalloregulator ArsR/SmtB family transcription factor [Lacisediminimonas sp.]|uniref:ArsR/SmtB family transcription factor n=1 Tax=Lacisediminimonas sp. TaxID=3060582 RepID=UPI002722F669|nr:metalloregulator ArsR/SmtB family transcription factor [Lacisediminimonas sp.]MDO8298261.1 metalloregulator ArsR/SmtB family transcription factor [Lacisediminimonas sp.]MDO9219288.1 metalloregulator ArsR/SmtB family transcription factor [Lacisediminimonas sp.]